MTSQQNQLAAAFALHQQGDLAGAERQYEALLQAAPDNPDLLYLLGMLCLDTGRAGMAAGYFGDAVRMAAAQGREVDPEWRLAHGSALQRDHKYEAALIIFDEVLVDDPKSVNGWFCRATVLQSLGRLDEAVENYKRLLGLAPDHAEAVNNMGTVLRDSGRPQAAKQAFRRALTINPKNPDALVNLGLLLEQGRRYAAAVKMLRRAAAISVEPDEETEIALSRCLVADGAVAEAVKGMESLVGKIPGSASALAELGRLHLFRGAAAQAAAHAREALAADPYCAAAHTILAQSGEDRDNQQALANIEAALGNPKIGSLDRASLYFSAAKRYGDSGDYDKEFESYIKANAIKRRRLAEIGYAYDPAAVEHAVDEHIAAFGRDAFAQAGASDSEIPVFIVGMPRSGTSLIEQILASHPEVAGAGELMFLNEAAGRLRRKAGYPATPLPAAPARDVASDFLDRLARAGGDARRITDKMPSNFMHIGLIAMLFPGARLIHSRRDPADTCLSCFFQNFAGTSVVFSYDLADLGHYYRQYSRLMEHWRQCLPDRPGLLEVDYEKLVGDQERESRRLIDFLGLDWSDSCLSFHETKRVVTTASHSQVRRPVYQTSVGRWKRYGDRLAPLLKSLAG